MSKWRVTRLLIFLAIGGQLGAWLVCAESNQPLPFDAQTHSEPIDSADCSHLAAPVCDAVAPVWQPPSNIALSGTLVLEAEIGRRLRPIMPQLNLPRTTLRSQSILLQI